MPRTRWPPRIVGAVVDHGGDPRGLAYFLDHAEARRTDSHADQACPSDKFKVTGKFVAEPAPHIENDPAIFDVPMEEHFGKVTWTGADRNQLWRHARQAPNPWGGECPTMFQRMPRSRRFQIHRRIGQSCIGRHGQGKIAECKRIERVVADISDRTGCEKFRGGRPGTNRRIQIAGARRDSRLVGAGRGRAGRKSEIRGGCRAGGGLACVRSRAARHRLGRQANAHRLQPRRLFGGGAAGAGPGPAGRQFGGRGGWRAFDLRRPGPLDADDRRSAQHRCGKLSAGWRGWLSNMQPQQLRYAAGDTFRRKTGRRRHDRRRRIALAVPSGEVRRGGDTGQRDGPSGSRCRSGRRESCQLRRSQYAA